MIAPRSSFARVFSTLTLVFAGGCSADANGVADVTDALDQAAEVVEALTSARSAAQPDYSADELEALAVSEEVTRSNDPFGHSPAPNQGLYVTASDGTRLAVSLYFPVGFDPATDRAPVVYVESWYPRLKEANGESIDLYRQAGFVVAIGDPRGFGASFGAQPGFLLERTRQDQREVLAWLRAQAWSSGELAVAGFSISATHADSMAASGAPGLRAAIVRQTDFDHYTENLFPGGVPNLGMGDFVSFLMHWIHGDICPDVAQCFIAPVDEDTDFKLLAAAFAEHRANPTADDFAGLVYRDDLLGAGTVEQLSAAGRVEELRRAALPARVTGSWLDGATAESALRRFSQLDRVPMEVFIGTHTHSSGLDADPFSPEAFRAARPSAEQQYAEDVSFVRRVLAGEHIGRRVRYRVLGSDAVKTTPTWPPHGVKSQSFAFTRTGLVPERPRARGERTYHVDPTTSAGTFTRWAAQTGAPVYYGDRRFAPGRVLSFDAEPASRDTELVGAPELCLVMRTDQTDGIVIAYLEDVAPNGRVTYLTEGELRLIHRKTAGGGCDPAPGTERSFARADASPVTPGELMSVELPLLPTAALIRKGHHLRVSLAGADAGPRRPFEFAGPTVETFPLLTESPATWSIAFGGANGSRLSVPLRRWTEH